MGWFRPGEMWKGVDMISITIDVDWAPPEALEYTLNILTSYGVRATVFTTGGYDIPDGFEVGVHPNFDQDEPECEVDRLLAENPGAKGVRAHRFCVCEPLYGMYMDKGLLYDASMFLPLHEGIYPVRYSERFWIAPTFWEDAWWLGPGRNFREWDGVGMKVYVFHPIHVFMNTKDRAHYEVFKPYYHSVPDLLRFHNDGDGVKTKFLSLLELMRGCDTFTLLEAVKSCV